MNKNSLTMLLLFFALFVAACSEEVNNCVTFEEAKNEGITSALPNITIGGRTNSEHPRFPIGVKAVLSVALKLQTLEDRDGTPRNFLVSPLAIAGALGELMLGANGELRKQIGVLLTLDENENTVKTNSDAVQSPVQVTRNADPTNNASMPQLSSRINAQEAQGYEPQLKMPFETTSVLRKDGTPSLELHRQLGGLIRHLSNPLRAPGDTIKNKSYLHASSAFFVDERLNLSETFTRALIDYYNASLVPVNYRDSPSKSQKLINDWGSTATGGLIPKFLPSPPKPNTAVIQAVAVHFQGAWQTPFIPEVTIPGEFQKSENKSVPVAYMRGTLDEALYAESQRLGVRILRMPYAGSECAMYIILPMDSNPLKYNLQKLVSHFTEKDMEELRTAGKPRTVNIIFPKLSLTSSLSVGAALKEHAEFIKRHEKQPDSVNPILVTRIENTVNNTTNSTTTPSDEMQKRPPCRSVNPSEEVVIGMRSMGSDNSDPSGILDSTEPIVTLTGAAADSSFRVSDVVQHIALEINEAGTEAAAIAGSTINYSGDVKNFKVKRPFLFFIREEQMGAVLFWGNIVDPTA